MAAAELYDRVSAPLQVWSVPLRSPPTALTFFADTIVAAFKDGTLHVYALSNAAAAPRLLSSHQLELPAICMAASKSSQSIFYGLGARNIERLELGPSGSLSASNDEKRRRLVGHVRGAVTALAAAHGMLYSAGNDQTIRLWDCRSCAALGVLAQDVVVPSSLSVLRDGEYLLSASHAGAGQISLWKLPSLLVAAGMREKCLTPVFSALGEALAKVTGGTVQSGGSGGGGGSGSGHVVGAGGANGGSGGAAAASRAVDDAAARSNAGSAIAGSLECMHTWCLDNNMVCTAVLAPGSHTGGLAALSASHTGEVMCWDLDRLREAGSWELAHFGHREPLCGLAIVGDAICTVANDRMLRVSRCPPKEGAATPAAGGSLRGGSFFASGASATPGPAPARPQAFTPASASTSHADSVEAMLRGVESAADELESSPSVVLL